MKSSTKAAAQLGELNKKKCEICKGEGWVCENHPNEAWNGGNQKCCGGAGSPCKCNKSDPPWAFIEDVNEKDIH